MFLSAVWDNKSKNCCANISDVEKQITALQSIQQIFGA